MSASVGVRFLPGPDALLAVAGEALEADEGRYGLLLGIARRLCREPRAYGPDEPWFAVLEQSGTPLAAVLRTPPYKVLLAHLAGDAQACAAALVAALRQRGAAVPGTVGDKVLTDAFAAQWCQAAGAAAARRMAQRVYRLTRVRPLPMARGRLRRAEPADADLVTRWGRAFHGGIFGEDSAEPVPDMAARIGRQEVSLWDDGGPVSMVAHGRPTRHGISINAVYTPPECRGRGYATSCVACVCDLLLAAGYRFCLLYADLANPISNAVYQRVGFEAVCDAADYTFCS